MCETQIDAEKYLRLNRSESLIDTHYFRTSVRDSADLKNKRICTDGSYGLFLTCREKKIGSVTHAIIVSS